MRLLFRRYAQTVQRPENQERPSDEARVLAVCRQRARRKDAAGLGKTPDVRVVGIVPIVAEHEVKARWNSVGCLPQARRRHVRGAWIERLSVDVDAKLSNR